MRCNEWVSRRPCGGTMRRGKVMAPVYGNSRGHVARGATIYQVTSTLRHGAWKCEKCGHTVDPGGMLTTTKPIRRNF